MTYFSKRKENKAMTQTFQEQAKELVRRNPDSIRRIAQYDANEFNRAMAQVFLEAAGEQ